MRSGTRARRSSAVPSCPGPYCSRAPSGTNRSTASASASWIGLRVPLRHARPGRRCCGRHLARRRDRVADRRPRRARCRPTPRVLARRRRRVHAARTPRCRNAVVPRVRTTRVISTSGRSTPVSSAGIALSRVGTKRAVGPLNTSRTPHPGINATISANASASRPSSGVGSQPSISRTEPTSRGDRRDGRTHRCAVVEAAQLRRRRRRARRSCQVAARREVHAEDGSRKAVHLATCASRSRFTAALWGVPAPVRQECCAGSRWCRRGWSGRARPACGAPVRRPRVDTRIGAEHLGGQVAQVAVGFRGHQLEHREGRRRCVARVDGALPGVAQQPHSGPQLGHRPRQHRVQQIVVAGRVDHPLVQPEHRDRLRTQRQPLAAERHDRDGPALADLADQRVVAQLGAVEEHLVELALAVHLRQRSHRQRRACPSAPRTSTGRGACRDPYGPAADRISRSWRPNSTPSGR